MGDHKMRILSSGFSLFLFIFTWTIWISNAFIFIGNKGFLQPMVLFGSLPKRSLNNIEKKTLESNEMSEEELHKMLYTRVGRKKRSEGFWKRISRSGRQKRSEEDLEKMMFTRIGR